MNSSIRSEDRLDGSSNFNNWKARIIAILEEHDLDQYVLTEITEPTSAAGRLPSSVTKEKQEESFTIL